VNSDLDKGIEKNLDPALIQNRMHDNVKYDVKSGVVTLTGEVNSEAKRDRAGKVATSVPNVKQVVNVCRLRITRPVLRNKSCGVDPPRERTTVDALP
jgi:osmotically-inducible protein OsmY